MNPFHSWVRSLKGDETVPAERESEQCGREERLSKQSPSEVWRDGSGTQVEFPSGWGMKSSSLEIGMKIACGCRYWHRSLGGSPLAAWWGYHLSEDDSKVLGTWGERTRPETVILYSDLSFIVWFIRWVISKIISFLSTHSFCFIWRSAQSFFRHVLFKHVLHTDPYPVSAHSSVWAPQGLNLFDLSPTHGATCSLLDGLYKPISAALWFGGSDGPHGVLLLPGGLASALWAARSPSSGSWILGGPQGAPLPLGGSCPEAAPLVALVFTGTPHPLLPRAPGPSGPFSCSSLLIALCVVVQECWSLEISFPSWEFSNASESVFPPLFFLSIQDLAVLQSHGSKRRLNLQFTAFETCTYQDKYIE